MYIYIYIYIQGDAKTAAAPPLGGIIGRAAGATGFKYSKAMAGSGIVWSDKHLFSFLKAPGKYVPGNYSIFFFFFIDLGLKMSYAGIENEQERADLIEYLKG